MKYINARTTQRFIAYLVDFILIQLVTSFILSLIPAYGDNMTLILDFYRDMMQGNITEDLEVLNAVMKGAAKVLGIMMLIQIPIYVLYLVVLPYFWQKQTLGRWMMHVKVVSLTEEKVKIPNLLLRELVGGYLFLNILSGFLVFPLLYWYFSATTGRSLSDMVGKTRLVDSLVTRSFEEESAEKPFQNDYIDAVVEEAPAKESKDEDTEYKVF